MHSLPIAALILILTLASCISHSPPPPLIIHPVLDANGNPQE